MLQPIHALAPCAMAVARRLRRESIRLWATYLDISPHVYVPFGSQRRLYTLRLKLGETCHFGKHHGGTARVRLGPSRLEISKYLYWLIGML